MSHQDNSRISLNPMFVRPEDEQELDRFQIPDKESQPGTAYQFVHDEAMLDGNARLNLATFVGTWMDDEARKLYLESADKNMIDKDEYPQTAEIEERCWKMLANLWNAADVENSIGCSTIGSSEACMLGGLALKRRWQHKRKAEGKSTERPNLIMSSAVQVCWEKFCNYFDVEARYVPINLEHKVLDGHDLEKYVDENTIGVVAIMGVTYTGMYEPVAKIAAALDEIEHKTGLDIPIHVDAASGGMIAPFMQPDLEWDFRVARVASISTSAHKYGLVYPGLGWVIWGKKDFLPEDLIFNVSYLGGSMPTFALNFSRPGAQVLLQYYMFLRLGKEGYTAVQGQSLSVAENLAREIGSMDEFELWNDGSDIPVFAWSLAGDISQLNSAGKPDNGQEASDGSESSGGNSRNWNLHHLSERLRMKGWLVPAYPMPDDITDLTVQRIVVRNGFSPDLAAKFLADLRAEVDYLNHLDGPLPSETTSQAFTH